MSYLQDFGKLHIGTKTTLLTILGTMPFFFISIYLFKPEMIYIIEGNPLTNIHFYFLLSLCLMISVLWFLMNLLLGLQSTDYIVQMDKKKINGNKESEKKEEKESVKEVGNESTIEFSKEQKDKIRLQIQKQREFNLTTTFIMTFVYSLAYLAVAIFLNQEFFKWEFKWFILGCFGFIIFRMLVLGFGMLVTKKKN